VTGCCEHTNELVIYLRRNLFVREFIYFACLFPQCKNSYHLGHESAKYYILQHPVARHLLFKSLI
jgi:hypothetical protein